MNAKGILKILIGRVGIIIGKFIQTVQDRVR